MPFLISAICIICLDLVWLGLIAQSLYRNTVGSILRISNNAIQPIWPAAIVVYVALVLGIVYFVLPRANGKLLPAFLWGALFGFVVYGTYDFTNLAVLENWNFKISLIDTAWGMFLCGTTSLITTFFMGK